MGSGRRPSGNRLSSLLIGAGLLLGAAGLATAWSTPRDPEPLPLPPRGPSAAPATRSPSSRAVADPPNRSIISDIGLEAPVVPARLTTMTEGSQVFITWEPPRGFAAGWLLTPAAPGQGGNVVLIGHHNIKGKAFRALHRLRPGQRIRVETSRQAYGFRWRGSTSCRGKVSLRRCGSGIWRGSCSPRRSASPWSRAGRQRTTPIA